MKTLVCYCSSCNMECEITYDETNFADPQFCTGCGDYEYLECEDKVGRKE